MPTIWQPGNWNFFKGKREVRNREAGEVRNKGELAGGTIGRRKRKEKGRAGRRHQEKKEKEREKQEASRGKKKRRRK